MLTVEVGGSSTQAIVFERPDQGEIVSLAQHKSDPWLLAAPGLVEGNRIRGAHHLGWMDIQASHELQMTSSPLLSMNDMEAAALGEWSLRAQPPGVLLYIGIGTGASAVAVREGALLPLEFGHRPGFGPKRCGGCGRVGCLDAQIGGHALPTPLRDEDIETVVDILKEAIRQQEIEFDLIVVGGGMPRRYSEIVSRLQKRIEPPVVSSVCPSQYKSSAPFGLLYAWQRTNPE